MISMISVEDYLDILNFIEMNCEPSALRWFRALSSYYALYSDEVDKFIEEVYEEVFCDDVEEE